MAKAKSETADEKVEQATLRGYAAADDEVTAADIAAAPEFTAEEMAEVLTPAQRWLVEAREAAAVKTKGEVYSADAIYALMAQAIPLVETLVDAQTTPTGASKY